MRAGPWSKRFGQCHSVMTDTRGTSSILCSDIEDGDQSFLADKEVVAFGWNTGDGRTTVMLVPAEAVRGNKSMTKDQIRSASIRAYTLMLGPHA